LNFDWKGVFGKPIDPSVFVTNVTNEIYAVSVGNAISGSGFEATTMSAPGMFGVRLQYNFGQYR
jgi:iron complex outermembrane receptor protein